MSPKTPLNRYTVKYDTETKLFTLWNNEGSCVGNDVNGRELGRDAWMMGAEEVCYSYDLTLDEEVPLISAYAKYRQNH
jgi:hypothetical protein